jgi:hypothetical protein
MQLAVNPNKEINMADKAIKKATIDLPLPDSGAGTATLSFTDAAGLATNLPAGSTTVWTSSDPTVVTVTGNPDNVTAKFAPAVPTKLGTGIIISSVTTLPNGNTLPAAGQPIDVVGGGPAGVQMVESVNP